MRERLAGLGMVALAVVLGLVAAGSIVAAQKRLAPTEAVVVLARDVAPWTVLGEQDVRTAVLAPADVPGDAVRDPGAALGKVHRLGGLGGDVLRAGALAEIRPDRGPVTTRVTALARDVGDGDLQAFSVPAEAAGGLASGLVPGSRVNVLAVVEVPAAGGGTRVLSRVLMVNVPVVHVLLPQDGGQGGWIVLGVKPEEAVVLALAQRRGSIVLTAPAMGAPGRMAGASVEALIGP